MESLCVIFVGFLSTGLTLIFVLNNTFADSIAESKWGIVFYCGKTDLILVLSLLNRGDENFDYLVTYS